MREVNELAATLERLGPVLQLGLRPAADLMLRTLAEGGKVMTCGNGGSACHASHLAAELTVRFELDRRPFAAISLGDMASITAALNDYGPEVVFSRQVEALGHPGDVLVAFSTSGNSRNVLEAIAAATRKGMRTLGIVGRKGFAAHVDEQLIVPSDNTARIQECHQLIIHMLCGLIEQGMPK